MEAEEIIGLKINTTMPYMGSNFVLANNLSQPITMKYPTDIAQSSLRRLLVIWSGQHASCAPDEMPNESER